MTPRGAVMVWGATLRIFGAFAAALDGEIEIRLVSLALPETDHCGS